MYFINCEGGNMSAELTNLASAMRSYAKTHYETAHLTEEQKTAVNKLYDISTDQKINNFVKEFIKNKETCIKDAKLPPDIVKVLDSQEQMLVRISDTVTISPSYVRPFLYFDSLKNIIGENAGEYEKKVKNRLKSQVRGTEAQKTAFANATYSKMVDLVRDSELTINFWPQYVMLNDRTQAKDVSSQGIVNYWENPFFGGDMHHHETRDKVEKSFLGLNNDPLTLKRPIDHIGVSERPAYAGLNIAKFEKGSAPAYGCGYFVLKDDVKKYTTFLPVDSFDETIGGQYQSPTDLANFEHPAAFINNKGVHALLDLMKNEHEDMWTRMDVWPDYVECHIHIPLTWDKIGKMVIDLGDIGEATFDQLERKLSPKDFQKLQLLKTSDSNRLDKHPEALAFCINTIKANAEKLAKQHDIKLEFKNDTLSLENGPVSKIALELLNELQEQEGFNQIDQNTLIKLLFNVNANQDVREFVARFLDGRKAYEMSGGFWPEDITNVLNQQEKKLLAISNTVIEENK